MSMRSQAQGQDLLAAHAGVEPEPQRVAGGRVAHRGLDALAPARQNLGRGRDPPPHRTVIASAAGEPLIGRVVQPLDIDAVAAVDGSQQGDDLVGRRPSGLPGDSIEAGLHVAAGDGVEGSCEPVAEIEADLVPVVPVGALLAVGIGGHVVLEGLSEGRHDARPGALAGRVLAGGDAAQQFLRQPPRPLRRDRP